MTSAASKQVLPERFDAKIVYATAGQSRPLMGYDQLRMEVEPTPVTMTDARSLAQAPSIWREGFELTDAPGAVSDFEDAEQVTEIYFPEIAKTVSDLTGAAKTLVYPTYIYREANLDGNGANRRMPAGQGAHIDFTAINAREFLSIVAEPEEVLSRHSRVAVYQTWLALSGGFQDLPLALTDGQTVSQADLLVADSRAPKELGPITEFEFYLGTPSPAHRWYYYRGMRPDEMLVFEGFDFADNPERRVLHTAFIDPTCPPGQPPRRSIEVRTFAFFD